MRRLLLVLAAVLPLLAVTTTPADPIEPVDARVFRVTVEGTAVPGAGVQDVDIIIPLLVKGTCFEVDEASFTLETEVETGIGRPIVTVPHQRVVTRQPTRGTVQIVAQLRGIPAGTVRWRAAYDVSTAASRANEAALRRATWARIWLEHLRPHLEPSPAIESDAPIFKDAVRDAVPEMRLMPPYDAAKTLVNYCIRNFKVTAGPEEEWWRRPHETDRRRDPDGVDHPDDRVRRLFRHRAGKPTSALAAARRGDGSPADLVALCVATLRAAGIPARTVLGIWAHESGTDLPMLWGEFYLQEIGWVPFDADGMEDVKNAAVRDVHTPWPGFASVPDLNRFIPLSHGTQLPRVAPNDYWRPLAKPNFMDAGQQLLSPDGAGRWPARTKISVTSKGLARPDLR